MKYWVKEMAIIPRLPEVWGSKLTQVLNDHLAYLKKHQDDLTIRSFMDAALPRANLGGVEKARLE